MGTGTVRRVIAVLGSVTLLASLTVATVAAPASAARPKCDGHTATIVSRKRVIRGTNRADVIVAKGAKGNTIYGKKGADVICAGRGQDTVYGARGNDTIFGGEAKDKLFGGRGRDVLIGGPKPDRLDGGPQTDNCQQGPGAGTEVNCEEADMSVDVECPPSGGLGVVPCTATVHNHGPDDASYFLARGEGTEVGHPDCVPSGWDEGFFRFGVLEAEADRDFSLDIDCTGVGTERVSAWVISDAHDPDSSNDSAGDLVEIFDY